MRCTRHLISTFLAMSAAACTDEHRAALPPAPAPLSPPKAVGRALEPIALPAPRPPANPAFARPSSAPVAPWLRAPASEVVP